MSNYLNVLTQRNFVAEFHRENISFICKTAQCSTVSKPPFVDLGVTYAIYPLLVGKLEVDFL